MIDFNNIPKEVYATIGKYLVDNVHGRPFVWPNVSTDKFEPFGGSKQDLYFRLFKLQEFMIRALYETVGWKEVAEE